MILIATYGTKAAAQQVYTKRENNNTNPRIKHVIYPTTHGFQLWSYIKGEKN